jgi:hypothetical protein
MAWQTSAAFHSRSQSKWPLSPGKESPEQDGRFGRVDHGSSPEDSSPRRLFSTDIEIRKRIALLFSLVRAEFLTFRVDSVIIV